MLTKSKKTINEGERWGNGNTGKGDTAWRLFCRLLCCYLSQLAGVALVLAHLEVSCHLPVREAEMASQTSMFAGNSCFTVLFLSRLSSKGSHAEEKVRAAAAAARTPTLRVRSLYMYMVGAGGLQERKDAQLKKCYSQTGHWKARDGRAEYKPHIAFRWIVRAGTVAGGPNTATP